jgi:hemerythrin-like metal-binding protein
MTMTPDEESAFQLGQDALDGEHQGQIDLLLAIEMELSGAGDTARVAALLDQLIEYTNIHFMSEQVEMRQQIYPGLPAHEAEHDQLMEQMRDFQQRIASGERTLSAADISTLRDWVLRHIRSKDAAFAEYLIASSITRRAEAIEQPAIVPARPAVFSLASSSSATHCHLGPSINLAWQC